MFLAISYTVLTLFLVVEAALIPSIRRTRVDNRLDLVEGSKIRNLLQCTVSVVILYLDQC